MQNQKRLTTYEKASGLMERELGITEARKEFSSIVEYVQHQGDTYVISRHGEPVAAVVPLQVYENWKRQRERLFDTIRQIQAANPDADPDQVMRDVLQAQQAVRASP
jgi:prevent-host-death family protein